MIARLTLRTQAAWRLLENCKVFLAEVSHLFPANLHVDNNINAGISLKKLEILNVRSEIAGHQCAAAHPHIPVTHVQRGTKLPVLYSAIGVRFVGDLRHQREFWGGAAAPPYLPHW